MDFQPLVVEFHALRMAGFVHYAVKETKQPFPGRFILKFVEGV